MSSFLPAFTALFVVVEPLGVVPTFAALTAGHTDAQRRTIARRAAWVGALILAVFAVVGRAVLDALGVRLDAFRIAGGLLLLFTALDMLRGEASRCRCNPRETRSEGDLAVVPLAIPLLSGPGAMATTMMLLTEGPGRLPVVLAAIALTFLISYAVLRAAGRLNQLLGPSVVSVVQRVLGLVLAAMALQSMLEGVRAFLPA